MKTMQRAAMALLLRYLANDPMEKLPGIFSLAEQLDRGRMHTAQIRTLREIMSDEDNVWYGFVESALGELHPRVVRKVAECLLVNASLDGESRARSVEMEYDCNVPWAILMDPTSACNLSCTGCWAAQYGDRHNLSFETLDSICAQGKELGTYFYIFSGGEPLVRAADIIRLCEAHPDCFFFAFTNGTLVDDALCRRMQRVGNFAMAFSIEGDEAATDMRRGSGTTQKVLGAMERMRRHRLLFGYSTCYHRHNTYSVGSDAFVDDMIARGCRFAWNFTYMPVGRHARPDLLATPEQRAYMYRRVREIRQTKPIFAMDFWNDGEYTQGCIAGGRRYLHINAAGDVEPCAFIHYANVNIHDVTLLEALQSPLMMAYRRGQPFHKNHLRPCPLLDNPQALRAMVEATGARSTEMESPEDVRCLCTRTEATAAAWAQEADRLWACRETGGVPAQQEAPDIYTLQT